MKKQILLIVCVSIIGILSLIYSFSTETGRDMLVDKSCNNDDDCTFAPECCHGCIHGEA
jgi:hypothetical protein